MKDSSDSIPYIANRNDVIQIVPPYALTPLIGVVAKSSPEFATTMFLGVDDFLNAFMDSLFNKKVKLTYCTTKIPHGEYALVGKLPYKFPYKPQAEQKGQQ